MSIQLSFCSLELNQKKTTRTKIFLEEMNKIIPWNDILSLVQSWKSESHTGRKGYLPETLLRMYLIQQWYGYSDEQTEDEIIEKISFQKFLNIDYTNDIPDATTLCRFREWMVKNTIQEKIFSLIMKYFDQKGMILKKGTMVDATIIKSPSSTKNIGKKRDVDASSTKKGSNYQFGYKTHIGMDQGSKIIRKVRVTTAKIHDSDMYDEVLSGDEKFVCADKGYFQKERKQKMRKNGICCMILDRSVRGKTLSHKQKKRNKKLSSVRALVETPFHIIKNIFHWGKTRYKGLQKNRAHYTGLCAWYNVYIMRKTLILQ